MPKYQEFTFRDYTFDSAAKLLTLTYEIGGEWFFTETYRFDFEFADYDEAVLDRALQALFLMTAVSYYKTFIPPVLQLGKIELDKAGADFYSRTYERGLGEFFYVNNLDPRTPVRFPVTRQTPLPVLDANLPDGLLIGIGGGKDSLVTAEALRNQPRVATWSLNHRPQLEPLVKKIGLPHFWVERTWDAQLFEMRDNPESLNGHVPISAIIGCVGAVVCILSDYKDHVVSNESSAGEPTLEYQGVAINHQYSKSLDFEKDFQDFLRHNFGDSLRYYSFLRPHTELKIAELFGKQSFDTYAPVFSSCNRAYKHESNRMFWCGECPKCAFVCLALSSFVPEQKLTGLWQGKNLLLDPGLETTYRELLGIEGDKPLECVGEIRESRAAMALARRQYPELMKYQFELQPDYDYRQAGVHSMPADLAEISLRLQ